MKEHMKQVSKGLPKPKLIDLVYYEPRLGQPEISHTGMKASPWRKSVLTKVVNGVPKKDELELIAEFKKQEAMLNTTKNLLITGVTIPGALITGAHADGVKGYGYGKDKFENVKYSLYKKLLPTLTTIVEELNVTEISEQYLFHNLDSVVNELSLLEDFPIPLTSELIELTNTFSTYERELISNLALLDDYKVMLRDIHLRKFNYVPYKFNIADAHPIKSLVFKRDFNLTDDAPSIPIQDLLTKDVMLADEEISEYLKVKSLTAPNEDRRIRDSLLPQTDTYFGNSNEADLEMYESLKEASPFFNYILDVIHNRIRNKEDIANIPLTLELKIKAIIDYPETFHRALQSIESSMGELTYLTDGFRDARFVNETEKELELVRVRELKSMLNLYETIMSKYPNLKEALINSSLNEVISDSYIMYQTKFNITVPSITAYTYCKAVEEEYYKPNVELITMVTEAPDYNKPTVIPFKYIKEYYKSLTLRDDLDNLLETGSVEEWMKIAGREK